MRKIKDPFNIDTSLTRPEKNKPLDWEESALDSESPVEDILDKSRQGPGYFWLGFLLFGVFLTLSGRIFYLQIIQGKNFRELSDDNRIRSQDILAPRGLILDRNGQDLVQNVASFNLVAVPFDLPKNQAGLKSELAQAGAAFGFDPNQLEAQVSSSGGNSLLPIVLKQNMGQDQEILFQTEAGQFPGLSIQQVPIRQYVDSTIFSHILGYTGLVSAQDLTHLDPTKYATVDFTGKSGIEQEYENYLHGQNGQNLVEVDATGKLLDVLGQNNPAPGDNLVLNIDKGLQEELYNQLEAEFKSDNNAANLRAAAVAMDPKNGQVLALVSIPGFDNNMFAGGISQEDYSSLINNPNLPLFNRAIAGTYPPGSTVKPMVAAAGLEEGVITPQTVIQDHGYLLVPDQFDPSIKYRFNGYASLGAMTVYTAIAESSDIYFYTVAGGYPGSQVPQGLGADKLASYYRKFNLGTVTGIDLPGEEPGLVPDPAWKASYYKNDPILSKWYLGDTYHIGIGQGDLLVTPLQVTEWTAAIANDGVGYVPQILNKVTDQSGNTVFQNQPKVLFNQFISEANLKVVQQGMRDTVTMGSGRELDHLTVDAAGKTGTSQFDAANPNLTNAWFTAYAPYEDPQIVITVLIEAGGGGDVVSEPVVKNVMAWWAKNEYSKTAAK